MRRILVIASHPDDEVIGCGGTMAKYVKAGDEVNLCIVTEPYLPDWTEKYIKNKENEIMLMHKTLGINLIHELKYPALRLDIVSRKEIADSLNTIIKETETEILFIPHDGDLNHDHRIVHDCALVAGRVSCSGVKKILVYETNGEFEIELFSPNVFEDITDFIDIKLKAMSCYKSELKKSPHSRSLCLLKTFAKARGSECGKQFAEGFMLLREIND